MYGREHRKNQPNSHANHPKIKNQFAQPNSFTQPSLTEQPDTNLQEQSAPEKQSSSNFWDVSIFTTNRPPQPPKPRIQMKLNLKKSGEENQIQKKENNLNQKSDTAKEISTGIAQQTAITRFSGAAKILQDSWGKQTTEERINALGELVNQELKNINSYPCRIRLKENLGAAYGIFYPLSWELFINSKLLSAPTINTEEMASILEVIYHEARHSEQFYRMARWRAGMKKNAPEIAQEMEIPINVAEAAVKNPLKPLEEEIIKPHSDADIKQNAQEIKEAQDWYNSVYGDKKQYRLDTLEALYKTRTEFEQAVAELKTKEVELAQATIKIQQADAKLSANTNDQNALAEYEQALTNWQQKTQEYDAIKKLVDERKKLTDKVYAQYENLPEEADAFAVSDKVASTYKKPQNKEIEK